MLEERIVDHEIHEIHEWSRANVQARTEAGVLAYQRLDAGER